MVDENDLHRDARDLKKVVAEKTLELRILKELDRSFQSGRHSQIGTVEIG